MKKKRTLFIFSLILLSIQMVLTADKISGMEADTEETDYNQEELSSAPDDNISFPEDVRVVPKGTVVDIDEDHSLVTVWQSPVEIFKGDTFIVYLQDLPIGYEALAVEKKGESASIFVQKADNTIFASVEESGELELTCENSEFFPAGGVEVIHDPFNDVESAGLTYDKDNKKLSLAVSLGSADAEVYLSNMSLSHTFSGGNLSISLSGSWGIETGVSQKLDSLAEVPLGEIRIAGVGKISLTFSMTQEMSVKATFTGAFRTGLTIDQNGVGKATKSFSVSQKNVTGEGIISASLKVTGGVDILVASADVYAEIGVKTEYKGETHTVNEDKIVFCEDFKYHLFSNVGAEAKYYSIMTDQMESIYSSELELAGEETSPIRLRMHFENGKNVGGCTLGTEAPNKQYGGVTTINSTVLSDNRGRISETNISLPYDMEVPSDFVISNGNVNLNGHTLVINGNLIHENGTLTIGAGTLVIHGDYRIQKGSAGTSGSQVYSDSTGALNMSNSNGTLTIDGDLVIQSGSSMNISSGTLNLNGNLKQYRTQQNDKAISFGTSLNLTMTNAASHLIYFENGECSIGKMIMQNDVTITSDATIGNVTVDAHNLTANGNLKHATGTTNLDCGTLTVMGNLLQTGGTIFVNGGILDVGGDYYIAGSRTVGNDGKETVTGCYGCLQMTNANDEVYVAGNFLTAGGGHTDYLTKGIMYLHGNFSQRSLNNGYSFNAKGSHKVKFEGTGRHEIYFQKYDYSGFA
ncbi:MAG: hypothetical protein IKE58_05150, partial [Blautia sp.]|nr:hypothetical protein [Blautia sp.]